MSLSNNTPRGTSIPRCSNIEGDASMTIYPYVYRLDHPITGEFYIGYRCNNKLPAGEDLGYEYLTSSKLVKPRFHEFTYHVIAEFFDKNDAYEFEQQLIYEYWKSPGILNKSCYHNQSAFRLKGHTKESRAKISASKSGQPKSIDSVARAVETRLKRKLLIGPEKRSDATKEKMRLAWKSRCPMTDETKEKIRQKALNRTPESIYEQKQRLLKSHRPRVCRLSDRREMWVSNFTQHPS